MDAVITLVGTTKYKNSYGVIIEAPTTRDVFAVKRDITRAEYFGAGRNGLNPEFMVTVFHGDYNGERTAQYNGQQYSIYRSFRPEGSDYVELYLERRGGTNLADQAAREELVNEDMYPITDEEGTILDVGRASNG